MAKTPAEIELDHFWRGTDRYEAYGFSDESGYEATKVFLDRNIVFQRTIVGDVTEQRAPHTVNGRQQMVAGVYYSANSDPEYWRAQVPRKWEYVQTMIEDALKAEAVLAYLEDEPARLASEASAAYARRCHELACKFTARADITFEGLPASTQYAIIRIIELEGATK